MPSLLHVCVLRAWRFLCGDESLQLTLAYSMCHNASAVAHAHARLVAPDGGVWSWQACQAISHNVGCVNGRGDRTASAV